MMLIGGSLTCAGAALVLAGCLARLALSDLRGLPGRRTFLPPTMDVCAALEDPEVTCTACHRGAETEDEAGTPDREICLSCHAGLRSAGLFDLGGDYFDEEARPKWAPEAVLPADVSFSHVGHVQFDCAECHGDVERQDFSLLDLAVRFANCRRCHWHEEATADCLHCHAFFDSSQRPHSHDRGWATAHGWTVRDAGGFGASDRTCGACHDRSFCVNCHLEEKPRDHTSFWVRAGHGLAADIDRTRCSVCHSQDECVRCHTDGALPVSACPDGTLPCLRAGCHMNKPWGHTVLTENCLLCHK